MSSFSRLLQIFTFTRRPWLHFFAKEKEKIRIISKSLVSLQFIFKPKSHIFHFTYKYFLKGISQKPKTSEKTRFLCQNDPKKIQKVNKLRLSCMSLMIKNCKFLKIPMGKLPRIYYMYNLLLNNNPLS